MVSHMTSPPQPPYGGTPAPPPGYASSDEKTWALIAHFGGAAGMLVGAGGAGWIAPLVALLAKGNESPTVRAHAVGALNFQITWSIVGVIGWVTSCFGIGFLLMVAAMALGIIFGVLAGVRANEGQLYRYPASLGLVK